MSQYIKGRTEDGIDYHLVPYGANACKLFLSDDSGAKVTATLGVSFDDFPTGELFEEIARQVFEGEQETIH